jgi:hypothetical protein
MPGGSEPARHFVFSSGATTTKGLAMKELTSRRRSIGSRILPLIIVACAALQGIAAKTVESPVEADDLAKKWGIEIVALRSSAAGMMIDFRYRVLDPDKAGIFLDRTKDAYLTDQESGLTVEVPVGKVGPLRQTTRAAKPVAGRIYFMLFSNPGRAIETGSKVTISIGDFRVEDLILE